MVERDKQDWKPRSGRNRQSITGVAYRSDGSWVRVYMTNLSYDGCSLLTGDPMSVGEMLTLVFPRTRHMTAQVRWAKESQVGVRFVTGSSVDARRARIGI